MMVVMQRPVQVAHCSWRWGQVAQAACRAHARAMRCNHSMRPSGCPLTLILPGSHLTSFLCVARYAGKHPALVELLMEWGVQAELLLGAAER